MLDSEKLALAAHLHLAMRRRVGRVTDVEWLVRNEDYAREIIRIALSQPDAPELHDLARRLASTFFLASQPAPLDALGPRTAPAPFRATAPGGLNPLAAAPAQAAPSGQPPTYAPGAPGASAGAREPAGRYIGRLR